jgi:predicted ATPase
MTQVFPATWGLWMASHYSGQINRSRGVARELLDLAAAQSDPALALQAHHANWTTMLSTAELTTCRLHAEQGIELYDINKHRSHAAVFGGHDPGVCARNHASQTAWFLGYPEQAVERARDGKALAEELAHFYSLALSFTFTSWMHQYRREPDLARARAEEGIRVCEEGGVAPHFIGSGIVVAGWAMAADGDPEKGIKEIQRGLDCWRATGAELRQSYFLGILAEAYLWADRIEEGLSTIAEALEYVDSCGEQRWVPEIYRLKGELLLSQSAANRAEAEACLQKAIRLARRQEAKSLELRAATSLSRLWSSQGKRIEARDVLAPVYNWFGEGLETPDLKDARALLNMCV